LLPANPAIINRGIWPSLVESIEDRSTPSGDLIFSGKFTPISALDSLVFAVAFFFKIFYF